MATKYIYISHGNSKENINLFSDFEKLENMKCIKTKKKNCNNIFLKVIRKIHLSKKIGKIISLPMKTIWYDLSEIEINDNDNYIIMMLPTVFFEYDISVIRRYSKYKNVKLVLILLDTIGVNTPVGRIIDSIYKDKMWDYIFTYDYHDAEKYGFEYLNEKYYSKKQVQPNGNIENDAYFIGGLKPGRVYENVSLFETLKNNGVNAKFDIVKNDGRTIEYEHKDFHILDERKTYAYILEQIQKTNCIVEFLQKGQNAQSLRYFEAVCFNKKLLTNNKNVKKLSFYNEKYMKVFETLEDIDFEWIKKQEEIDYGYKDEFSPIHIIRKIEKMEKI